MITSLDAGGAQIQLYRIVKELNKSQFKPFVISMMDRGHVGEMLLKEGIPVYQLGIKRGRPQFKALFQLYKLLRREQPAILNTFLYHSDLIGRIIGSMAGVPVIISSIRSIFFGSKRRELFIKLTNVLCDVTTVNSKAAAKRMIENMIVPAHKLRMIPNGIDINVFKSSYVVGERLRLENGLQEDEFCWIAVGRFDPPKNYFCLLNAFNQVIQTCSEAVLFIVGEGPLRSECEKLAKELGLERNVRFLGIRKDVVDLMNMADAYVMSSSWEGMPNVLMEAASTGLPIVSTNVGGVSELVRHLETGYLVKPDDTEELVDTMLKMMNLQKEKREKMGFVARQYIAENYQIEVIVKQWEELYKQLLKGKIHKIKI